MGEETIEGFIPPGDSILTKLSDNVYVAVYLDEKQNICIGKYLERDTFRGMTKGVIKINSSELAAAVAEAIKTKIEERAGHP